MIKWTTLLCYNPQRHNKTRLGQISACSLLFAYFCNFDQIYKKSSLFHIASTFWRTCSEASTTIYGFRQKPFETGSARASIYKNRSFSTNQLFFPTSDMTQRENNGAIFNIAEINETYTAYLDLNEKLLVQPNTHSLTVVDQQIKL